jgi:ketosteroid isomerase-like protein
MRRLALAVVALTFVTACRPATTELTEEQKAEIAAEVNAINTEMWDAWRAADFDRGASYFDLATLVFAYEGTMFGFATFDEMWRPVFATIASQTITVEDSLTTVLAPNAVCIMQAGTYTQTDTAGVTSAEGSFAFTGVWVPRDGEWKLDFVHESFPTAEAESM